MITRRTLVLAAPLAMQAATQPRITGFELIPVRATERTVWLFVRLHTDKGLTGLGEASDAFGYQNTTKANAITMETELRRCFELVQGQVPDVLRYRATGRERALTGGLVAATAFSAIEQALWDLIGQMQGRPIHKLLGGAVRRRIPVYANINRSTQPRTPAGFAATAKRAYADGFRAMKAAPFDGFPQTTVEQGIAAMFAIRDAVGSDVQLMVDCHSFFDVVLAQEVARKLEPLNLTWYEEPVAPERTAETLRIHQSIRQPMAGGEVLFGIEGFLPLCQQRAVDVIMPDVKHCGGVTELTKIAQLAAQYNIAVAPHNPSGPVSTAHSAHVCAGLANFRIGELQWGEAAWRGDLVLPPEKFTGGSIAVSQRAGLGLKLNDRLARAHPI
jgi:galactonate dehydratase